mmetsp:Transcript_37388/g.89913  ORF Transcript_37388/g.89913 Transcript_37388/m.89913 type:complete len:270 (-) Transcript_37388:376-1185(-)
MDLLAVSLGPPRPWQAPQARSSNRHWAVRGPAPGVVFAGEPKLLRDLLGEGPGSCLVLLLLQRAMSGHARAAPHLSSAWPIKRRESQHIFQQLQKDLAVALEHWELGEISPDVTVPEDNLPADDLLQMRRFLRRGCPHRGYDLVQHGVPPSLLHKRRPPRRHLKHHAPQAPHICLGPRQFPRPRAGRRLVAQQDLRGVVAHPLPQRVPLARPWRGAEIPEMLGVGQADVLLCVQEDVGGGDVVVGRAEVNKVVQGKSNLSNDPSDPRLF